jgi:hypothetical protein
MDPDLHIGQTQVETPSLVMKFLQSSHHLDRKSLDFLISLLPSSKSHDLLNEASFKVLHYDVALSLDSSMVEILWNVFQSRVVFFFHEELFIDTSCGPQGNLHGYLLGSRFAFVEADHVPSSLSEMPLEHKLILSVGDLRWVVFLLFA